LELLSSLRRHVVVGAIVDFGIAPLAVGGHIVHHLLELWVLGHVLMQ